MGAFDFGLLMSKSHIFNNVSAEMDKELFNTLLVTMNKGETSGCQNFALPLLNDLQTLLKIIKNSGAQWHDNNEIMPIHYAVLKSANPDYFSLGGDLNYFRQCIKNKNSEELYKYSKLCLDLTYEWASLSNTGMTTIALVQGKALGGGFETALSADFLIAEEHSQFGFPEIMFGLFPCSGGMSLLSRRIGVHQAEKMMTNAKIYSAPELKEMGVIDEICAKGEGNLAVEKFINNHAKRRAARVMLQRSRHRVAPLNYSELLTVVNEWVELAMQLGDEELRVMEMLVRMQQSNHQATARSPIVQTNSLKEAA